jgi:hypothetical protein
MVAVCGGYAGGMGVGEAAAWNTHGLSDSSGFEALTL